MKESKKKYLTNPCKTDTIRISISYRSVPGKCGPEFVRSADLQSPPHKWHGFRILTHNPEVSGSNPLPATNARAIWRFILGKRKRSVVPAEGMVFESTPRYKRQRNLAFYFGKTKEVSGPRGGDGIRIHSPLQTPEQSGVLFWAGV